MDVAWFLITICLCISIYIYAVKRETAQQQRLFELQARLDAQRQAHRAELSQVQAWYDARERAQQADLSRMQTRLDTQETARQAERSDIQARLDAQDDANRAELWDVRAQFVMRNGELLSGYNRLQGLHRVLRYQYSTLQAGQRITNDDLRRSIRAAERERDLARSRLANLEGRHDDLTCEHADLQQRVRELERRNAECTAGPGEQGAQEGAGSTSVQVHHVERGDIERQEEALRKMDRSHRSRAAGRNLLRQGVQGQPASEQQRPANRPGTRAALNAAVEELRASVAWQVQTGTFAPTNEEFELYPSMEIGDEEPDEDSESIEPSLSPVPSNSDIPALSPDECSSESSQDRGSGLGSSFRTRDTEEQVSVHEYYLPDPNDGS